MATDSLLSMTAELQRQGMKTSQENEAQSETGLWHPLPFSEVGDGMISKSGPIIRLSGQSTSLTNLLIRVLSPEPPRGGEQNGLHRVILGLPYTHHGRRAPLHDATVL